MTLDELIERLTEYRDTLGGEAEVRLMTQQNWPFENTIAGLVSQEEIHDSTDRDGEECDEATEAIVYLCEGSQLGYGSKQAWEAAY